MEAIFLSCVKTCKNQFIVLKYEDPSSDVSKMDDKSIIFSVDPSCFFMRLWWPKVIPKIHKKTEPTMTLISHIGLYYLLDCDYLLQVRITVFYYFCYIESCMLLASAIATGSFQWISQVILTKLLSNIVNLKQAEKIACKNVLLSLLHNFLKRSIRSSCCTTSLQI